MSRAISRTYKIVVVLLFTVTSSAFASTSDTVPGVSVKTLLHKMPRAKLVALLGATALSDSSWQNEDGYPLRKLLFEPVVFEGTRTLMEVLLDRDTTAMITVYLPYIGRPSTRLKFPFEYANFVKSTQEDYNQMERKIEDELGVPTVLTGVNFEYIIPEKMQSIFGVFEDGYTKISIIPSYEP